jgi:hypothetical protein
MLIVAGILLAACGKKGPPLPPIVRIPAAVDKMEARRRGSEVVVTVTVPSKNIDGSMPADIGRIEVYGYTGTAPPPRGRFLEVATQIGTITVPQPVEGAERTDSLEPRVATGEPIPGGPAAVRETLTPETLVARPIPPASPLPDRRGAPPVPPVATAVEAGPLRRFYLALAFSPRGRPGPPSVIAELRLTLLPDPPSRVQATYGADAVQLEWEPSGGLIGFLLERALSPELAPLETPEHESAAAAGGLQFPEGATRYNVYREVARPDPDPAAGAASPAAPQFVLLNPAPLDALTFVDQLAALDGLERCYVVRAVRGSGLQAVEGDASARECVTTVDDFAPQPPTGLAAISGEGAITLIWEPNAEPDVAGYVVLRGEPGDATLTPVTDTVVTDARFTDRTVRPGVRYVYAVQAIDTRLPRPNVSDPSARVEEAAR